MSLRNFYKDYIKPIFDIRELTAFLLILIGIILTSFYSYALFHTFAEIFSIIIAGSIFVITWNSRKNIDNTFILIIGISFFFIGIVDIYHTLAYKGIALFTQYDSSLSIELWLIARYLQSIAFLFAALHAKKEINPNYLIIVYSLYTGIFLFAAFYGYFPNTYVEGVGLTLFKIISEYVIIAIFGLTILFLYPQRRLFNKKVYYLINLSILSVIISEFFFTAYIGVFDVSNLIGHVFKIISFYFLYKALLVIGIEKPMEVMFRELKKSEEKLSEKAQELEISNLSLQKEIEEKTDVEKHLYKFISTISHELRTPITVIDNSLKNLKDHDQEISPDTRSQLRDSIERNVNILSELVQDLLILTKIDRKKYKIDYQEYNPYIVMKNAVSLMETRRKLKNISIEILKPDNPPKLFGDPHKISQVFRLILDNSLKYSPPNSEILIKFQDNVILKGKKSDQKGIIVSITDEGIGIDEKDLPYIFNRFYRSNDVKDISGTGLGLSIAQELVKLHQGTIEVESKKGHGSSFSIFLPYLSAKD